MRHFIHIVFLLLTAYCLVGCVNNGRKIGKTDTAYGSIKFYAVIVPGDKAVVEKIYAAADSNHIRRYYSFYPDRIVMTEESAKGLAYTVFFEPPPADFDSSIFRGLSSLDTLVFSRVQPQLQKKSYAHLKRPQGATGFLIEVNALHGFPRHRKFRPL